MKTIVRNKYVRNYEDQNRQKSKIIPKKFRSKNHEFKIIRQISKGICKYFRVIKKKFSYLVKMEFQL